jgi:hypothetical protein
MDYSRNFTITELDDGTTIIEELEKDNPLYKENRIIVRHSGAMYYILTQLNSKKVMITDPMLRSYILNLIKLMDHELDEQPFTPSIMYDEQTVKELRLAREKPVTFTPEFNNIVSEEIRERTQEIVDETNSSLAEMLHKGLHKEVNTIKPTRKLRRFQ